MKRKTAQVRMTSLLPPGFVAVAQRPRIGPAYLLWGLLGFLGAHRIYCRRPLGYAQGGLFIGGVLTAIGMDLVPIEGFFGPVWVIWTWLGGVCAAVAAVVWMLVDGFRIPGWVRKSRTAVGTTSHLATTHESG
ncbi:MAG: hypothetical protein OXI71_11690 [Gemmatimonadota bacterium]|nr:hypothetical protein [Gemmatimonadota bacterium]